MPTLRPIEAAFQRAAGLGTVAPPASLKEWLDTARTGSAEEIAQLATLVQQLTAAPRAAIAGMILSDHDLNEWALLLRWMMQAAIAWRPTDGIRYLIAICMLAEAQDDDGHFWLLAPDEVGGNVELLDWLSKAVRHQRPDMSAATDDAASRNAIERYREADARKDWVAVLGVLSRAQLVRAESQQMFRILHRYSPDRLKDASDTITQSATALDLARSLPVDSAIELGLATASEHVEFGVVCRAFLNSEPIPNEVIARVADLLVKVGSRDRGWKMWAATFVKFFGRRHGIWKPLGLALSKLPLERSKEFIEGVPLDKHISPDRVCIADCFRLFRSLASIEAQEAVWKLAYERWKLHRFGADGKDSAPTAVETSSLDYLVVGYFVCCCTDAEVDGTVMQIYEAMRDIEVKWFNSLSDCRSELYRLLSELQPVAHAASAKRENLDWLMQGRRYQLPRELQTDYFTFRHSAPRYESVHQ
jgi:hypothetical protein